MSYNPVTDFLGLLRQTSGGVRTERMPGLDYIVAAMARAGMFALSVGQTAPTTNQAATAWLRPSVPSWVAEGVIFLWNSNTAEYEPATPILWSNLLSAQNASTFQSVTAVAGRVATGTSILAIQRDAPAATALTLPNLAAQFVTRRPLKIVDFSTNVVNHAISLATPDGATIMRSAGWEIISTPDQLAGVMLQPSPDLNAWIIAP